MSDPIDPIEIAAKAIALFGGGESHMSRSAYTDVARAVIAALEEAGYKIVRRNPTEQMVIATYASEIWRTMFDFAPTYTPPAEERK